MELIMIALTLVAAVLFGAVTLWSGRELYRQLSARARQAR